MGWHGCCAPGAAARPPTLTKPLSVLLIDDNPTRAEIVEAGLAAAGYRLLARLEGTQDLIGRVRELEPDVVVVSIDSPSRDTIEDMRRTTDLMPRPIASVSLEPAGATSTRRLPSRSMRLAFRTRPRWST